MDESSIKFEYDESFDQLNEYESEMPQPSSKTVIIEKFQENIVKMSQPSSDTVIVDKFQENIVKMNMKKLINQKRQFLKQSEAQKTAA